MEKQKLHLIISQVKFLNKNLVRQIYIELAGDGRLVDARQWYIEWRGWA